MDPGGQYAVAGNLLLALGAAGIVVAGCAALLQLELRLIDASTMAAFGALMAVTGAWQRRIGKRRVGGHARAD